jgi:LemA protein
MQTTLLIILAIIIFVALWLIAVYNGLIRAKNQTTEAFSDIDVQLKRRYDLIPNLVNTVKGYAQHEQSLFTAVTQARAQAMTARSLNDKAQAENALSQTLKSLFAVSENYPELKASQNFLQLQDELADTENKIQAARRFYNGNVRDFNIKIQIFPNNLFASLLGFHSFEFFGVEETEKEPVKVQF